MSDDEAINKLLDDQNPLPDYNTLVATVKTMPKTWYPGLLIELVRAAYKRGGIFKPRGASRLVEMKCEE